MFDGGAAAAAAASSRFYGPIWSMPACQVVSRGYVCGACVVRNEMYPPKRTTDENSLGDGSTDEQEMYCMLAYLLALHPQYTINLTKSSKLQKHTNYVEPFHSFVVMVGFICGSEGLKAVKANRVERPWWDRKRFTALRSV